MRESLYSFPLQFVGIRNSGLQEGGIHGKVMSENYPCEPLPSCAIKTKGFQWKTTYWPKNSCRVCHEKLFYVTCMITTDDNLTENFTIPDIIETSSNNKLFNGDHKRQTAVCGYWFHDICLPIFRKQDSRVVACGCHVCFYSFVHFYYS